MSDVTKSPTSAEFSVLVLLTFSLKKDILGLNVMVMEVVSKIYSSTVVDLYFF